MPLTAGSRDRFADLLRTLALGAVVLGHWTMAAIGRDAEGGLVVDNVLNSERWLWPLTWVLVLIPLFFFVGGFSNATSWSRVVERTTGPTGEAPGPLRLWVVFVRRRLGGLLRPLVPFVLLVAAVVAVALALGAPPGLTRTVTVVVVMPLWFVAVFAVLALVAPVMLRLHRRYGWRVVVALSLAVLVVELVLMVSGEAAVGYANYVLVWGTAQQLGFAYADGSLQRLPRRAVAWWAVLVLVALAAVTASPWWAESMIGLSGERSNFSPPGIVPLLLGLVQIPVALLLRPVVAPLLDRPRTARALDAASGSSMRAFLWHLPVMVAVTGVLLVLDVPFPDPGTATWWLTRPLWFAVLGLALWGVLAATDALRARTARGVR
ncbi:hypothetical protein Sked_35530 [Sanguibacter keddieii DSM 10542]|uniref:Acyltransferase 3 domain-containing protein n=1 Tax=Sanguibacter keddieii (strain ATCC 51767 / DSM 10542 / NCFB 3025 / ST-74) TaxID=446469 RepID=D1BFD7_SANKS|nr:acyltransferase family protein [Sanguibacter keddieii]ACZ23440.1 hypothetical protein Sked_35530 [Sanguibacter keddieii DSM 10542]